MKDAGIFALCEGLSELISQERIEIKKGNERSWDHAC
jgi:hypothetical protein